MGMVVVRSESRDEFKKLSTPKNLYYLYQMGKQNGSLTIYRTLLHYYQPAPWVKKIKFPFVLLSKDKDWSDDLVDENHVVVGRVDLNRLVEILVATGWTGFFESCWWTSEVLSFIVAENTPPEFRNLVALHESIELDLQGVAESCTQDVSCHFEGKERERFLAEEMPRAGLHAHQEACETEIHRAIQRGQRFFEKYARWQWAGNYVDNPENFFDQAILGFMSRKTNLSPVAKMVEFYLHLTIGVNGDPAFLLRGIEALRQSQRERNYKNMGRRRLWFIRCVDQIVEELSNP